MTFLATETVTRVRHWNDTLFSFNTTRDMGFRYESGQFTMLGLKVDGIPLLRAYSLVSATYESELEFLSIKVPNGPLTSRLANLSVGDQVLISSKPVGTLVLRDLLPGENLFLLSTGTGLAPFMSIIRDPETYERFERVFLVHGTRRVSDLAYREYIEKSLPVDDPISEIVADKLLYYPTVTREEFRNKGRITKILTAGESLGDIGISDFNTKTDRFMICGSNSMLSEVSERLTKMGFAMSSGGVPADFVIERAFVEK